MIINRLYFRYFPRQIRHLFNFHVKSEIEGKSIVAPLKTGRGLESFWRRSWKTEVIARLGKAEDAAFIDIGANLGQTLIDHYLADTETQYIGFEPNPHCVYYLTELIKANSLSRHTILPVGLANEAKIEPLYSRKGNSDDDSATLIEGLRPTWELASQYVPCYRFDDVCRTLELKKISLIKIDVEGFELEVIKGMQETIKNLKPVILCEVLFPDENADHSFNKSRNEQMIQILDDLNYKVLQLIKTPDDLRVIDAKLIEGFSNETFSEENRLLCDYLFVPAEEEKRVLEKLLKK